MNDPAPPSSPPSEPSGRNRNSVAVNAFSRVLAVMFLMLLIGIGGSYLDKWLGTTYLTIVGFILGGVIAMVGMLYVVRAAEFDTKQYKEENGERRDLGE